MAPLEPNITLRALLPNGPLALSLLIVAVTRVPPATISCPLKVLAPDKVRVPAPETVTAPVPLITPEIAGVSLARLARITSSLTPLLMPLPPLMVDEPVPAFRMPFTVTVWLEARVKSYAPFIFRVSMEIVVWALIEPVI